MKVLYRSEFEAIRIYYRTESDTLHVIRILHGKRDIKQELQRQT